MEEASWIGIGAIGVTIIGWWVANRQLGKERRLNNAPCEFTWNAVATTSLSEQQTRLWPTKLFLGESKETCESCSELDLVTLNFENTGAEDIVKEFKVQVEFCGKDVDVAPRCHFYVAGKEESSSFEQSISFAQIDTKVDSKLKYEISFPHFNRDDLAEVTFLMSGVLETKIDSSAPAIESRGPRQVRHDQDPNEPIIDTQKEKKRKVSLVALAILSLIALVSWADTNRRLIGTHRILSSTLEELNEERRATAANSQSASNSNRQALGELERKLALTESRLRTTESSLAESQKKVKQIESELSTSQEVRKKLQADLTFTQRRVDSAISSLRNIAKYLKNSNLENAVLLEVVIELQSAVTTMKEIDALQRDNTGG